MKPKFLYLSINILSFIVPFLFSFYPKANFSKKWKFVLPAIILTAVVFLIWDVIFTELGVWGFNSRYTLGIDLLGLPVEEILFFFCIPYACLFTYFALNYLIEKDHLFPHQELISSVLIIVLLVLGGYYLHQLYTGVTFILAGLFLAFLVLKLRTRFMGRFYFAFAVLLIPFFLVNGILTGSFLEEPVVWYNDAENLGIRIGTVPVEDIIYAMLMLLVSITIAEKLEEFARYRR
ncbi:MAG TPA: lycopene cyclase domain-containing protein [Chryseosolibacter sp.]